MSSINIAKVKSAAADLIRKARKADTNHDGAVTSAELRAGRARIGEAAVHGIHKMKSAMVGNQWYDAGSPNAPGGLKISVLKRAVAKGVGQLVKIDTYSGNASAHKPGNKKDGVVTSREIKNYGPGHGKLPYFAAQIVWYANQRAPQAKK